MSGRYHSPSPHRSHARRSHSPPRRSSRSNSRSRSPPQERSRKDVTCRTYAKGTCYRGNACWYSHDDPEAAAREWEWRRKYFEEERRHEGDRRRRHEEDEAGNDREKRRKHESLSSREASREEVDVEFRRSKSDVIEEGTRLPSSSERSEQQHQQPQVEQANINSQPKPARETEHVNAASEFVVPPPPPEAGPPPAAEQPPAQAQKPREDNQESRSLKVLRNAVTEVVKESLKPAWKEGRLSKEVFKTVAQKAVEKVMGTLQGHEIPKGQAKIDQFMENSHKKILRLVQGYLDKYAIV